MKRAAIYARYSSDRQNDRSIEDQVTLCRALAEREGLNVVAVYEDRALSAASLIGRAGIQDLLADARSAKFDVVVAEALDRLSRDQEDLAGLHKRLRFMGIAIHTFADGAAGEIHVGVKGLLGSLYLKDLAQKTRRGLAGVVDSGRHAGGRAFGYRPVLGQRGELAIDEAEAEIVRRIFSDYNAGKTPREIAHTLNREGVPGPRTAWNASTIYGSRERQNGILRNELYVGRIVWNRQRFEKDPDTGRRVSRPNAESDWKRTDAPHLRIVADDVWAAAQARQAENTAKGPQACRRPHYLLSGLVKCAACGSGYVTSGAGRLGCSAARERGTCTNTRTIARAEVENRVLAAIRDNLLHPDLAAEYLKAFHEEMRELRRAETADRSKNERKLKDATAAIERTVRAIGDGLIEGEEAKARMAELRAAKAAAEAALAQCPDDSVVELHPAAMGHYRGIILALHAAVAAGEALDGEIIQKARALIERVEIACEGSRQPVEITVHGSIAALVQPAETRQKKSPIPENRYGGLVVAGTRSMRSPILPPPLRLIA